MNGWLAALVVAIFAMQTRPKRMPWGPQSRVWAKAVRRSAKALAEPARDDHASLADWTPEPEPEPAWSGPALVPYVEDPYAVRDELGEQLARARQEIKALRAANARLAERLINNSAPPLRTGSARLTALVNDAKATPLRERLDRRPPPPPEPREATK